MSVPLRQATIPPREALQRSEAPFCRTCRKPLTPRQIKIGGKSCSARCRSRFWTVRRPRISVPIAPPGERPAGLIRDRILALMTDGRWYTDLEIATALGILEGTAGAKRRDLRKKRFGRFKFEKRFAVRPYSNKLREHRLVLP